VEGQLFRGAGNANKLRDLHHHDIALVPPVRDDDRFTVVRNWCWLEREASEDRLSLLIGNEWSQMIGARWPTRTRLIRASVLKQDKAEAGSLLERLCSNNAITAESYSSLKGDGGLVRIVVEDTVYVSDVVALPNQEGLPRMNVFAAEPRA
jgi:hypothetical protein